MDKLVPHLSDYFVERSFSMIEKGEYAAPNACGPLVADKVKAELEQKLFVEPNFLESTVSKSSNFKYVSDVAINNAADHIVVGGINESKDKKIIYQLKNNAFKKQHEIIDTVRGPEVQCFDSVTDDLYCLCQNGDVVVAPPGYTQTKKFISLEGVPQSISITPDGAHLVVVVKDDAQSWVTIIDKKTKNQICIEEKNGLPKIDYLYGASLSDDKKYLKFWDFDRKNQKIGELLGFANAQKDNKANTTQITMKPVFSKNSNQVTMSDDGKFIAWIAGFKIKIKELLSMRQAEAEINPASYLSEGLAIKFTENGRYLVCNEYCQYKKGFRGVGQSIFCLNNNEKSLSINLWGKDSLPAVYQSAVQIRNDGKFAIYQARAKKDIAVFDINSLCSFKMQPAIDIPMQYSDSEVVPLILSFHPEKRLLVVANRAGQFQLINFERWASYIEKTKTGGIEKTQEVFHQMKKELSEKKNFFAKKQEVNQPSSTNSLSAYNPLVGLASITNALSSFNPSSTNNNNNNNS